MSDLDATMTFQDDEASVSGSSVSPQQESKKRRIRQNLSHLSQEEKLNRRKMKNRVAAQSARDRRKAKFEELEKELAQLSEERFKLARENARLRKHTISLEAENKGLKQRLSAGLEQSGLPLSPAITVKTEPSDESITATDDSVASFGSAAFICVSQQQKQGSQSDQKKRCSPTPTVNATSMMLFVCLVAAIQMKFLNGLNAVRSSLPLKPNSVKAISLLPMQCSQSALPTDSGQLQLRSFVT